MFKSMTISARLGVGLGAVMLVFMGVLLLAGIQLTEMKKGAQQIKDETMPYILLTDEMALSVSQVQQFLTDVSATHHTDGYQDADAAARRFLAGVTKFKAMYQLENDARSLKAVDNLETRFKAFYALGKDMAGVYVAKGLDAGNKAMETFDQEAYLRRTGKLSLSSAEVRNLSIDLNKLLEILPPELSALCRRLETDTITEISHDTGIPRTTLYGLIKKLKTILEKAGFREYL